MALIDDFKARFPEFNTGDVDTYIPILSDVWPHYYGFEYNEDRKEIILNLVAHLLTAELDTAQESVRLTQSESVGSVSVSYAAQTHKGGVSYDFFNTTKYGQRFLMMTAKRYGGKPV